MQMKTARQRNSDGRQMMFGNEQLLANRGADPLAHIHPQNDRIGITT
jgi:hypothetical protein